MTRAGIRFLTVNDVMVIHDDALGGHGGLAGIRDLGLLESAVMMPQAAFGGKYLHPDIPAMAAAYVFHICQAHAFHDGNKRCAVLAGLIFLDNNAYDVTASDDDVIALGLGVAKGSLNKSDATLWMRKFSRRVRE
ncbi:MAG: type II toxin-antitoxin system death-on-curing family toxin [Phycisphaerae bacterium]